MTTIQFARTIVVLGFIIGFSSMIIAVLMISPLWLIGVAVGITMTGFGDSLERSQSS